MLPLIVEESESLRNRRWLKADPQMVVWWGTSIECVSAICRKEREGTMSDIEAGLAIGMLRDLESAWHEIAPGSDVKKTAVRLLRVHPLRAADACQLAAALVVAERAPENLPFVCGDHLLNRAAEREGFTVLA